ncbi:insulin gene enhancer protein ISL-1-like isoform X1 [Mya arenaria]|nr:insulin gene enhancer protein ISL-1-like isoform X1 [Mya arenaria]
MTADAQPPPTPTKRRRLSMCVGCGSQILDPFILRVAPDLEWHASCLKCADCNEFLDETRTCFVRDGKTYCKRDYARLFGQRCAKCDNSFLKNDFVMRARDNAYHIDCFRCVACSRQLIPGDEFALRDDGLFCKADHDVVERASVKDENSDCESSPSGKSSNSLNNNNNNNTNNNNLDKTKSNILNNNIKNEKGISSERRDHIGPGKNGHKKDHKPTRVRTVLNEKQLHTLRTCYNANPRPDALMKEQLVEMTNLSPRVIRVWFQNKRCKDKKRSILMKQMQQQQQDKNGGRLHGPMQGVPMVASSPVRHESPMTANPVEVQTYQPPWKALSDFAMQSDLDHHPPFQQLMNSFDHMDSDYNDSHVTVESYHGNHMDDGYVWSGHDEYGHPGSVNSDYGETPSDMSSPMSQ